ncbi:DUF6209 family protein [Myxococcus fulvus]|uniref:DUF6209 family protein n=1 Tax=Myxococcus fulvus TaxID=33 RepID=UPI0020C0B569|nr:DUF6209 family protein [Myxococcus fulvus]MCK8498382.1 DUF6209 family protein [Myxococcus fulvus]
MKHILPLFTLPLLFIASAAAAQGSPVISFHADWTLTQSRTLVAGDAVQVTYDTSRLPQCRLTLPDGTPGWSLTGHYRVNGGPEGSFDVAGQPTAGAPPVVSLPSEGTLALWFRVSSPGCEHYDSHFGSNFQFAVRAAGTAPTPTWVFQEGWLEYTVGTVKAGQPFLVDYDIDRLPECRLLYNGAPTWEVWVHYRFDNGVTGSQSVTQVSGYSRYGVPVTLTPPAGARAVTLWFENWDRGYCRRWDSLYGQNYRLALQP